MIRSIRSNKDTFKKVEFHEGLNVILATKEETGVADKKSNGRTRNGAGKTTLIEIIHFCLCANVDTSSIFHKSKRLAGWSFTLEIDINGKTYELERSVDNHNCIYIKGDHEHLGLNLESDKKSGRYFISPFHLKEALLYPFFGINKESLDIKYLPTFRNLISYCIRRSSDSYEQPFEFSKKQTKKSVQLCNSYFLDLNMSYASEFCEIKERRDNLREYKELLGSDVIEDYVPSKTKLETEARSKKEEVEKLKKQLDNFRVDSQYYDIAKDADIITKEIHNLSNDLVIKKQLLTNYQESVKEEVIETPISEIKHIYNEVGILFGDKICVKLDEVINFHKTLVDNRRKYLQQTIERLKSDLAQTENKIEKLDKQRSQQMVILKAKGALEEYTLLQEKYSASLQDYEMIQTHLGKISKLDKDLRDITKLSIELNEKATQDYNEREKEISETTSIYEKNMRFLYKDGGDLVISIENNTKKTPGYNFEVKKEGIKSQGIKYMSVFCYDMLLQELQKNKLSYPDFLVHDSTIFDGVDERQVAKALMLAKEKSDKVGFQYICLMNSDAIPEDEFDPEFKTIFEESVVLKLDDETEEGGLLGIRF